MADEEKKISHRVLANDSLTTSHIEQRLDVTKRSLTTAHIQQKIENVIPTQSQGEAGTATPSSGSGQQGSNNKK
ncbi:MAG: hypothetical protein ACYCOR_08655 [Acidobacteriaceae bacterium]